MGRQGPKLSLCRQRRLWSDWAKLIWVFAGRTLILLVLSWGGSFHTVLLVLVVHDVFIFHTNRRWFYLRSDIVFSVLLTNVFDVMISNLKALHGHEYSHFEFCRLIYWWILKKTDVFDTLGSPKLQQFSDCYDVISAFSDLWNNIQRCLFPPRCITGL